jgi:hypothetical protein
MPSLGWVKRKPCILPIGPSIAYVPLTKGLFALIDSSDVELVERYCWQACYYKTVDSHYALSAEPRENGKRKRVSMHRLLSGLPINSQSDHKNRNTLDNRRANLRKATVSQNQQNAKIRSDNVSGYKGVRFIPKLNKWVGRAWVNGKRIYTGYADTAEEAHHLRVLVIEEAHGDFARP